MTSPSKQPRFQWLLKLSPAYLVGLFGLLMVIFLSTILLEYRARRAEIEHTMREEAVLLIHALTDGAEQALNSYHQHRLLMTSNLLDQLHLLNRIDSKSPLTSSDLQRIADSNILYRITIFDKDGKRIAFTTPPDHTPLLEPQCNPQEELQPLFLKTSDEVVLGIRYSSSNRAPRLIAAVARSRGGAIVGNYDASNLLALRKQIGVGRLIQRISKDNTAIDYILWQDDSALLAATSNVTHVEPLQADAWLSAALLRPTPTTRFTIVNGHEVFEVVAPLHYQETNVGLLRIGLKTDHVVSLQTKLLYRFAFLALLALFGGFVFFKLAMTRRNEALMTTAFEQSQKLASTILESMGDSVIAVQSEGNITMVNEAAEKLFGIPTYKLLHTPCTTLQPDIAALLREVMLTKQPSLSKELELLIQAKKVVLSVHCSLINNSNGAIEGALAVLHDLSEQRALQTMLNRQEKLTAMGELASGVAHEIRNPLNAIGILAQRLDIEFTPQSDEREYRDLLRTVISEVKRVNTIIQRFLAFARPAPLAMVAIKVDDFVMEYCSFLQSMAEAKGITFKVQAHSNATVMLDSEQMRQVLLNMVRNSIEATPQGGIIEIDSYSKEENVIIAIRDNGSGISTKDIKQIFNLYFTTRSNGNGMGLSIAHQIVQAHEGIIEVEQRISGGTEFRIVLPMVALSLGLCYQWWSD